MSKLKKAIFGNEPTKTEVIDVGEMVICDMCGTDYSESDEPGGFIFGSKGVCPQCAPDMQARIEKHNEEEHIKAYCPMWQSFREFILKARGGDNTIKITTPI